MTLPDVEVAAAPDLGGVAAEIEERLLSSLRGNDPPSDHAPLAVVARGEDGLLLGGLVGSTSYGWLPVRALWVAEPARGRGLGTRLMEAAERTASRRGCHAAWLDTSSARAERFY